MNNEEAEAPQQPTLRERISGWWVSICFYTKLTFLVCVIVYLVQQVWPALTYNLMFNYYLITRKFQVWRLFTFAYLHGGILHIIFNMMALISLGIALEKRIGTVSMMMMSTVLNFMSSFINTGIIFFLSVTGSFGEFIPKLWGSTLKGTPMRPGGLIYGGGVGYSGILFSYMILSVYYVPAARNCCGLQIPAHIYPWFILLICQFMMPNVSLLGHLSGIFAGYLFIYLVLKRKFWNKAIRFVDKYVPARIRNFGSFIETVDMPGPDEDTGNRIGIRERLSGFWNRMRGNTNYQPMEEDGEDDGTIVDLERGTTPRSEVKTFDGPGRRLGDS